MFRALEVLSVSVHTIHAITSEIFFLPRYSGYIESCIFSERSITPSVDLVIMIFHARKAVVKY